MHFFPSSGYVHTTTWRHHIDTDKAYRKRARRQFQKNVASYNEQILEAISHKAAAVWTSTYHPKTIQIRRIRHAGHCWRSKDELMSDVLLLTISHRRASVGRPARTYLQLLSTGTGCSLEDLLEAMYDRGEWRERVKEISACGIT